MEEKIVILNSNDLTITGKVSSIEFSHTYTNPKTNKTEKFYKGQIEVARLSDNVDIVPVIISEKLLFHNEVKAEDLITMVGHVRTRNFTDEEEKRNHLSVFAYAEDFVKIDDDSYAAITDKNLVTLTGFVCKQPTYRTTNSGRIITDLLIACNRKFGKSDYIPVICWGANAKMAEKLRVGDEISVEGRFQSRRYRRKSDIENRTNVAYEVSATNFTIANDTPTEMSADADSNVVDFNSYRAEKANNTQEDNENIA